MWGRRDPVIFDFALCGPPGVLDQMMTLRYQGQTTAAPVIRYRALDEQGRTIDVEVHSCYGSDRGEMALTDGENTDLLYFRGPDAHLAVDVAAEIVELRPLERPENPITLVVQNDADDNELPSGRGFDHLTVVNQSPTEALCRVVAIALDEPGRGSQGAIAVVPMTQEPLLVPPRGQVRLDPPPAAYAEISRYFGSSWVTVKSYPAARETLR
jgi:hypothetical protein